ncbi:hypothetical protein [Pseudomonas fluorescens]|uniref:hypothetical protein n=1 Tax=Pseudomonas fluorescens TaxID=294 RepID=UPI00123F134B|nr:hypothetical protein [Pseudomonas fluorescens]
MNSTTLKVNFIGDELLGKNLLAESLMRFLEDEVAGVNPHIQRESGNTMDMGATLAIILGSASITAIAKGIGNWIRKNNEASIILTMGDRTLDVKNVRASDIQQIIYAFMSENEKFKG